ncbi:hypothetical protein [Sinomonas flava]|uniref:Bacterial Pleckstrin homology domain-containing protein n=1 Tax=Sinomonas flava TaxID=496857 RepID=A0ABN3BQQ9_9MICC
METTPVMEFTSHIEGKNAKVRIYSDRIEWDRDKSRSVAAAAFTSGMSLLAPRKKASTDMIPIKQITGVTTKRDGLVNSKVCVITSGNTIEFRVSHADAAAVKNAISQLIIG